MSTANWIKLRVNVWDKAEVQYLAESCEIPTEYAVGILCKLWTWFDQHTEEGVTNKFGTKMIEKYTRISVTKECDEVVTSVTGVKIIVTPFLKAMQEVEWIFLTEDGFWSLINWGEHNGETAKKRAGSQKRQEKSRSNKKKDVPVTQVRDKGVTREEKRREENIREEDTLNTLSNPADKTIKNIIKSSDDSEFIAFYNRYNVKQGKEKAFKAWKKLNLSDKIEAFEKVEHYFSTIKEGISKVHPSTYLNAKRWTDEISQDTVKPKLSNGVKNIKDIFSSMQKSKNLNEIQNTQLGALNVI